MDDLMHIMNWRIRKMAEVESAQARFFRTLAALAPGFGLLGTLAGMVAMLRELGTGDIARVGSGMAVAMLATLYGVVLSNLIRSEARRVGKECVSTCRSRWWPYH